MTSVNKCQALACHNHVSLYNNSIGYKRIMINDTIHTTLIGTYSTFGSVLMVIPVLAAFVIEWIPQGYIWRGIVYVRTGW